MAVTQLLMFAQLQKMLRKGDTVSVIIAIENDTQLRVNVFPKLFTLDGENGNDRKALNTPLSLVATPAELDSPAFLETLEKFTASTNVLRHTLDEVEATHKTAAEAAKKKTTGGTSSTSPKSKPAKAEKPAEPKEPKEEAPKSATAATPSLI